MQLLNTLYVTLPDAWLRLDNDNLRIEVERETRLRVPLHHLTAVVCFGHVGLSAPLMHRLADEGITLVLLDANGRFKARLEGAVSGNVLLRQAQFARCADTAFTLEQARTFVAGKIKNTRQVLQRGAREAKSQEDARVLTRRVDEGLHRRAEAEPARQREAALAPAEAPRNGAQVLDALAGLARGRA